MCPSIMTLLSILKYILSNRAVTVEFVTAILEIITMWVNLHL